MYHRNSDYALNKQDPDAIVCKSVTGVHTRLRCEDFSSEEEFQIWKDWSDADYHAAENADGQLFDHSLSINILLDCPTPSAENTMIEYIDQKEQKEVQAVEKPGLCIKYKPGFWRIEAKEVQV